MILDGAFLMREQRDRANELSRRRGAAMLCVLCACPRKTAIAQIPNRVKLGDCESEGRIDSYDAQDRDFQEPCDDESAVHIDTTTDSAYQTRAVFSALRNQLLVIRLNL